MTGTQQEIVADVMTARWVGMLAPELNSEEQTACPLHLVHSSIPQDGSRLLTPYEELLFKAHGHTARVCCALQHGQAPSLSGGSRDSF